ncbi:MAG TPA: TetR/AcrR family transcriptional regulator [Pseudonocardia sp.]|jgi:AcrR family transcriptional regulator|uniref:TetR/AcrR family transcriptional regulator n=1 Tax=Pseudonocardia sp. TaxID=60912 RepID=UPI002B4B2446|nr:TetR/AcrR family transcriptional regulator [Pseudonocardia sp.]HLU54093.1 TetR/AcrR family transcriptional regulator [Pseudonocardia sp.]
MTAGTRTRGRIDKRLAILEAASVVFAREGYAQAGVDEIAAEAGVAKATVYSHFGDKQTLLRECLMTEADRAAQANLEAVERLLEPGSDVRAALEDVAVKLLQCYTDQRSWALRRLVTAEVPQHPELVDVYCTRASTRVSQALADRLLALSVAGHLSVPDPALAAEHFASLLTGGMDTRTRFGTRAVPEEELREVAKAAVDTFLRAFAPA